MSTIEKIEKIDTAMDLAVEKGDREQLIVLNQKFHSKLFCANPDQLSLPMIESIWLQLGPFMRIALQHIGTFYTIDRHKEIITALRNRNLAGLQQAIDADIRDGDLLVVQKSSTCHNGDIVIALLDDEATVKRFYKERDRYRLQPENPSMQPIYIQRDDPSFRIIGKVKGLLRKF